MATLRGESEDISGSCAASVATPVNETLIAIAARIEIGVLAALPSSADP